MLFSESIKQIALLGTSRKNIQPTDLPVGLAEYVNQTNKQPADPEDSFLQALALYALYYKSGVQTIHLKDSILSPSDEESLNYITKEAAALLPLVLETEDVYFLQLWLTKAQQSTHIISPEWIPALYALTESYPQLNESVSACCGERGKWVARFNPRWKLQEQASLEDQWTYGPALERKKALHHIRTENPEHGLELLQKIWGEENASMRLDFLSILEQTLTESDEVWLKTLQKDKSQKVKDKAFDLIKRLPDSQIVRLYIQTVKETFQIKKEKSLLGLVNSPKIKITPLSNADPLLWESGIEKLSNIKDISDDLFVVMQLLAHIPPSILEIQNSLSAEEILTILKNDSVGINLIESIQKAAYRFMDTRWAEQLIRLFPEELEPELLATLPAELRAAYLIKHMKNNPDGVVQLALKHVETWPAELTQLIFTHTSKNGYSYSKAFYTNSIPHLSIQSIELLPSIQTNDYTEHLWTNHRSFITNRLQLKKDIQQTTF